MKKSIKELRNDLGWSQATLANTLGIPRRTIENWESGVNNPPEYVERLIASQLDSYLHPPKDYKILNESVKHYADICKKFSRETADWFDLDSFLFYTTDGSFDWKESSDNAHGGIDISWAFQIPEKEIEARAAEKLFSLLLEEVQLAVSDEWEPDQLAVSFEKFSL